MLIKICGITEPADAEAAIVQGADAIGLNFHEPSPRFVDATRARLILRIVPAAVEAIGVFVDQRLHAGIKLVEGLDNIHTLQWHGDNRALSDPGRYRLIPAFAVRDGNSLAEIIQFVQQARVGGWIPAAVLVDAHVRGVPGGTGQTAPWKLLAEFRPGVPLFLAGGLTPDNVAEAIRIVRPDAVDVATGVERSPGRKDPEKIKRFIGNARIAADKCAL